MAENLERSEGLKQETKGLREEGRKVSNLEKGGVVVGRGNGHSGGCVRKEKKELWNRRVGLWRHGMNAATDIKELY